MKNKISVVMCTYNGSKYVSQQIDSIINQTYVVDEIIICDDRSTDNTYDILLKYAELDKRIKVFKNLEQLGANLNFAKAFMLASNEYILPSDQDDIWAKDKVECLMQVIGDNLLVYSYDNLLFEDKTIKLQKYCHFNNKYWQLFSSIPGHTMMFKKELCHEVLKACENSQYYDFMLLYLSVKYNNKVVCYERPLQTWRRNSNCLTSDFLGKSTVVSNLKLSKWGIVHQVLKDCSEGINYKKEFARVYIPFSKLKSNGLIIRMICKYMALQKRYSLILAALLFMFYSSSYTMIRQTKGKVNIRQWLSHKLYSFRYPFYVLYTTK